jgi:hypothetical protein
MTEYRLSELGITEDDLFDTLHTLYPNQYSYKYNKDNTDIIYLSSKDGKFATMPDIEIINTFKTNKKLEEELRINKENENKNRIHHHVDEDIINKIPVENYEYIQFINDLPVYKYNCHSHSKQNIFCIPKSKESAISCCDENCINVNNLIGIMLTNIKYLNQQIELLKK